MNDIKKNKLQKEAVDNFYDHYYEKKNTRGILCACCGYGKSYLIYKIIKKCIEKKEKLFIIATSRIKLVEQIGPQIHKWNNCEENLKINLQISVLCCENIYKNKKYQNRKKLNISEIEPNEINNSLINLIFAKSRIEII